MTIEVRLHGVQGTRTQAVTPTGFTTRHINRAAIIPTESVKVTPDLPKPTTQPAPVPTPEAPKMPSGLHQNDRFLTGIKATLKISGKWETAPSVFHHFYDKYNLVELRDIKIGLDILAKANEIQSKVVEGEKQYFLPTSDFERLLDRYQVSRFHLAEVTGIDEDVMIGYCKGAEISTADAHTIVDTLNIELSELEGMVEVRTDLTALLAEVDAIMGVQ